MLAALFATDHTAIADVLYQLPNFGVVQTGFNNSQTTETEDNFVANSFTVQAGGTHLTKVGFFLGGLPANQPATVAIYTGSSLTTPSAGGGLVRVATGTATLSTTPQGYQVDLAQPVDLAIGQIFYAGLLLPALPGTFHPFATYSFTTPQGHSFFDVGPTQGAPYDLDNTANLTVLGGTHPVVGAGVQNPGDLVLTVTGTPEPSAAALLLPSIAAVLLMHRRRIRG